MRHGRLQIRSSSLPMCMEFPDIPSRANLAKVFIAYFYTTTEVEYCGLLTTAYSPMLWVNGHLLSCRPPMSQSWGPPSCPVTYCSPPPSAAEDYPSGYRRSLSKRTPTTSVPHIIEDYRWCYATRDEFILAIRNH